MVMNLIQVRLPEKIISEIDLLVDKGYYETKSDAIREAIREFILEKQIGSLVNTGDSVKEIRKIRKILSQEKFDLDAINKLAD